MVDTVLDTVAGLIAGATLPNSQANSNGKTLPNNNNNGKTLPNNQSINNGKTLDKPGGKSVPKSERTGAS